VKIFFYRLNVFNIELPALRERKEDINALAKSFMQSESAEMQISKAALQALNDYNWKGNVRELESVIKRAVIFAKSENRSMIQLTDLPKKLLKKQNIVSKILFLNHCEVKNSHTHL